MEKFLDIIRFMLISGENLILIVIITWEYYSPSYFIKIGHNIKTCSDVFKWLPSIPSFCILSSLALAWRIITPWGDANTRALYDWPKFWKIYYRVIASLIICSMTIIAAIILWAYADDLSERSLGIIFASLVAVPAVSLFCQLLAAIKVRVLLDRYVDR
jgi:hypothetical protein